MNSLKIVLGFLNFALSLKLGWCCARNLPTLRNQKCSNHQGINIWHELLTNNLRFFKFRGKFETWMMPCSKFISVTNSCYYGRFWTANLKQPLEVFFKKGVLQNSANFTGKQLCWSLFLIKLQVCIYKWLLLLHARGSHTVQTYLPVQS